MTPEHKEEWLHRVAKGKGKWTEAIALGYSPLAVKQLLKVDEDFAEALHLAEELALEPVLEELRGAASDRDSPHFMRAAKELLNAHHSDFSPPAKAEAKPENQTNTINIETVIAQLEAKNEELEARPIIDLPTGVGGGTGVESEDPGVPEGAQGGLPLAEPGDES